MDKVSGSVPGNMEWLVTLDHGFTNAAMALVGLAAILFLVELVSKRKILGKIGNFAMIGATVATLGQLVSRHFYMVRFDSEYFPLTNLFESIMFMVFMALAIYIAINRLFAPPVFGLVSSGLVVSIMAFASLLPPRLRDAQPLMPSLQSYWLKIHVSLMMASYAAFFISFVLASIYLIFHYRDRWFSPRAAGAMAAKSFKASISTLELLDEATFRTILFGFPLLGFGVITGALWANHAWGTYWSWDPKETWALITWLFYAAYLHTRHVHDWKGPKAAWFAVFGFISVIVTYLGVNYLASGLHSYGKFL